MPLLLDWSEKLDFGIIYSPVTQPFLHSATGLVLCRDYCLTTGSNWSWPYRINIRSQTVTDCFSSSTQSSSVNRLSDIPCIRFIIATSDIMMFNSIYFDQFFWLWVTVLSNRLIASQWQTIIDQCGCVFVVMGTWKTHHPCIEIFGHWTHVVLFSHLLATVFFFSYSMKNTMSLRWLNQKL